VKGLRGRSCEGVRIDECTAKNAREDDAQASAEYGASVTDRGATAHGAQVRHYLRNSHLVGSKFVLVRELGQSAADYTDRGSTQH
jgi:hypothetical protein